MEIKSGTRKNAKDFRRLADNCIIRLLEAYSYKGWPPSPLKTILNKGTQDPGIHPFQTQRDINTQPTVQKKTNPLDRHHGCTDEGGQADSGENHDKFRSTETSSSIRGVFVASGAWGATRARFAITAGVGSLSLGSRRLTAGALETWAITGTVLHVLLGIAWKLWEFLLAVNIPFRYFLGRALARATLLVVTAVTSGILDLGEHGLESVEVGELRWVRACTALDLNKTVVAGFLGVFVDETTRVDAGHLLGVESLDLAEVTLVDVATVLRQEDGDAIVFEFLDFLVPAGSLERGWRAPGVVVEGKEVRTLIVRTAVHVVGSLLAVGVDISLKIVSLSYYFLE